MSTIDTRPLLCFQTRVELRPVRSIANLRKDPGFHLVGHGVDLVSNHGPPGHVFEIGAAENCMGCSFVYQPAASFACAG
eukprot:COSAG01_NODE_26057_length_724_cov_27.251200_2_plen_79_part_00